MDREAFNGLLEKAVSEAEGDAEDVCDLVRESLSKLAPEEILSFERHREEWMAETYRWDLWAVAYIINSGCSDDGFDYFRGWLLAQGPSRWTAALENPAVIGDWVEPGEYIELESMNYVAYEAYQAVTGKEFPHDFVSVPLPDDPSGEPWEEDEVDKLFPELAEKFEF